MQKDSSLSDRVGVVQSGAFYDCSDLEHMEVGSAESDILASVIQPSLDNLIRQSGFTFMGSTMTRYSGPETDGYEKHGYTYEAVIGESAVTLHTWPEDGYVDFVIHVCNAPGTHNEDKFPVLYDLFKSYFGSVSAPFLNPIQYIPRVKPQEAPQKQGLPAWLQPLLKPRGG